KPSRSLSVPVLALEGAVFPLDIDRYQFAGARLRKRCSKHGDDVVTPGESARLWKTTPVGARVAGHASFRCASLPMTCDNAVFPKPHSNGTGMTGEGFRSLRSLLPEEGAVPVGGAEIDVDLPHAVAIEGEKLRVAELLPLAGDDLVEHERV